jgi:hypothetical protein
VAGSPPRHIPCPASRTEAGREARRVVAAAEMGRPRRVVEQGVMGLWLAPRLTWRRWSRYSRHCPGSLSTSSARK